VFSPSQHAADWIVGVDGCRGQWIVVLRDRISRDLRMRAVPTFCDVLSLVERPIVVAVDMPIGLPAAARRGGRDCERLARELLQGRKSSVFSSPSRAALECYRSHGGHQEVSEANRRSGPNAPGLTLQTFHILDKISDVDSALSPPVGKAIVEVHPEVCFYEANGCRPMVEGKKSRPGREERERLLAVLGFGPVMQLNRPSGVKRDDVLDACIACWTAERVADGIAQVLPSAPPKDDRGLEMALWA
jgi:predicted RNase H-like nuclease